MLFMPFHVIQPKPRIDYTLKAVGGSLTALPGVSDMIDVSFSMILLHINHVISFIIRADQFFSIARTLLILLLRICYNGPTGLLFLLV